MTYDIIGTIYTQGEYDSEGNVIVAPVAIDGYHVNIATADLTEVLEPYVIVPVTPKQVLLGTPTTALKFASRDEWLAMGIEEVNNG